MDLGILGWKSSWVLNGLLFEAWEIRSSAKMQMMEARLVKFERPSKNFRTVCVRLYGVWPAGARKSTVINKSM